MVPSHPLRSECEALPKGWIREEIPRLNKNLEGKNSDIYYISPMGKRIRSKPELLKMMGDVYDLKAFDYATGKMNPSLVSRPKPSSTRNGGGGVESNGGGGKRKRPVITYDITKNMKEDRDLVAPIRQTASIFKQPVTVSQQINLAYTV